MLMAGANIPGGYLTCFASTLPLANGAKVIGHIAMAGFTSGEALKLFDTCVCANGSLGFRGGDRAHLYFIQDKEEAPPKEKSFFSRKKPFPETKTCPLTDFCVRSRFIQVRA